MDAEEYTGQKPVEIKLDWADLNALQRELPSLTGIVMPFIVEKILRQAVRIKG